MCPLFLGHFLLENYSNYFDDFTCWLSGERSLCICEKNAQIICAVTAQLIRGSFGFVVRYLARMMHTLYEPLRDKPNDWGGGGDLRREKTG